MKRVFSVYASLFFIKLSLAQGIFKYQTNLGLSVNSFSFNDAIGADINYASTTSKDLRVGILYKKDTTAAFSFGLTFGTLNLNASSMKSFNNVFLNLITSDLSVNYEINQWVFNQISIGPSLSYLYYSLQQNANSTIINNGFEQIHFGINSEIGFLKRAFDSHSAQPYLFYRSILTNIEGNDYTTERSSYTTIGCGIKILL
jgi:hypothetical protein